MFHINVSVAEMNPCQIYGPLHSAILIFQGVLTKFNFSMKFPHLEKNCQFNEIPKI